MADPNSYAPGAQTPYTPHNNNTFTPDDYTYSHFPGMEAAYEDLKKIITELDTVTDDLYKDVAEVLGTAWTGAAKDYFDQKKAEWNAIEKQMGEQLFNAAAAVNIAKGNYQEAERYNIALWTD